MMKKILFLIVSTVFLQLTVFAQIHSSLLCPKFHVEEPNMAIKPGEKVQFKVVFDNSFNTSNLKLYWTISDGVLVSGQGTNSIFVKPNDAITVTIKLQGLPPNCFETTASAATNWYRPPQAILENYSKISLKEEKDKLSNFADEVKNDPTAVALIIKILPRNVSRRKVYLKLQQISTHLENHGVEKERISFGVAYGDQEKTTLWLIPAGATPPEFKGEVLSAKNLAEKTTGKKPNR